MIDFWFDAGLSERWRMTEYDSTKIDAVSNVDREGKRVEESDSYRGVVRPLEVKVDELWGKAWRCRSPA